MVLAASCSTSTTVPEIPEEALALIVPSCPARFVSAMFSPDLPGSGSGAMKITFGGHVVLF